MAEVKLLELGVGIVPAPIKILTSEDGKVNNESIVEVNAYLELLAQKVNRISFGDNTNYSRAGNHDAQRITIKSVSPANTPIAIDHSLGRVPYGRFIVDQNGPGVVYSVRIGDWTDKTVYMASNDTTTLFDILLF